MLRPHELQRVVVVVLDGLRPDAIDRFGLSNLRELTSLGASTLRARTITPSLTWPALTSLLTGVAPAVHGIVSDSIFMPRPRVELQPLPQLLRERGYCASAFLGDIPFVYRSLGGAIARGLGFSDARFAGATASEVLRAALPTLRSQRDGLVFMHWVDADRAGHRHGWMSPHYRAAARHLDFALGLLAAALDVENDPSTMLIALGDHGGGGIDPRHHEGTHALNATIPLIFANRGIESRDLGEISLLDVPTSIAWALGVQPPTSYVGRVVIQPITTPTESAVA